MKLTLYSTVWIQSEMKPQLQMDSFYMEKIHSASKGIYIYIEISGKVEV